MTRLSHHSASRLIASGFAILAASNCLLTPAAFAASGGYSTSSSTSTSTSSSSGPKGGGCEKGASQASTASAGDRSVKIVEGALDITLTADQRTAVSSAGTKEDTSIQAAAATFREVLKTVDKSTASATVKQATITAATNAAQTAMSAAEDTFYSSVAKTVDQEVADVKTKIQDYMAGKKKNGKGEKGGGGCKGKGGGGSSSGSSGSTGGTGSGSTGSTGTTTTTGTYGS